MTVDAPPQTGTAVEKSGTAVDYVLKVTVRMLGIETDVGRRAVAQQVDELLRRLGLDNALGAVTD
jgi:hypothetical protein